MEWIPIKKNIDYAIFMGLRTFIYILEVDPPEYLFYFSWKIFSKLSFNSKASTVKNMK